MLVCANTGCEGSKPQLSCCLTDNNIACLIFLLPWHSNSLALKWPMHQCSTSCPARSWWITLQSVNAAGISHFILVTTLFITPATWEQQEAPVPLAGSSWDISASFTLHPLEVRAKLSAHWPSLPQQSAYAQTCAGRYSCRYVCKVKMHALHIPG